MCVQAHVFRKIKIKEYFKAARNEKDILEEALLGLGWEELGHRVLAVS